MLADREAIYMASEHVLVTTDAAQPAKLVGGTDKDPGVRCTVSVDDRARCAGVDQYVGHLRGPLVFCDMNGELLGTVDTRLPLWRACKKAGLGQVGWHALRHTFASHLVMRGASLKAVQELLGHSSIQMTMRYAHLAPEVVNETVRLLDGPAAEWGPDGVGQSLGRATAPKTKKAATATS